MKNVPRQVKFKGRNVTILNKDGNNATIEFRHAGFWHDYTKVVEMSQLDEIEQHKCDFDNFAEQCPICGKRHS